MHMRFGDDATHASFQARSDNERVKMLHFALSKHMNIHQMYGSEQFIIRAKKKTYIKCTAHLARV